MRLCRDLMPVLILALALAGCASAGAPTDEAVLFPPIEEPLESGYLRVTGMHELYWERVGNPEGHPVIVLHGGPGGRAGPGSRRYFDPERFHVLLFDQRGAGRSRPFAEWRENTTADLVQDIVRLREHVGFDEPAIVFGGSWGSTLALAYAQAHPEQVAGLVLRGVFLGTREEIDHFYHGGAAAFFPENWERLRSILPEPDRMDYPRQLFEMTQSEDLELRALAENEWARYEIRMARVGLDDVRTEEILESFDPRAFSVLENHYMSHGCFLEEGQLLRDMPRIAHIPAFIVNGRLDVICRPHAAWQLSQRFEDVRLVLAPGAGHSAAEPPIRAALVEGVEWVATRAFAAAREVE